VKEDEFGGKTRLFMFEKGTMRSVETTLRKGGRDKRERWRW
jgi:hypothetical protein